MASRKGGISKWTNAASEATTLLVSMIIRPPRAQYHPEDLGLSKFVLYGHAFERIDSEVVNSRGLVLQCSHFLPLPRRPGPCVVYLHGNCGSRLDGCNLVPLLGPTGIQVFCFDFAGSGLSEGEFISLGLFEKDDVAAVIHHLRESGLVTTIGLWGRSMGAATALMYAADDPSIAGLVVDSPFANLRTLAKELVGSPQLPISVPKSAVSLGLGVMRKTIKKKAKFDINDLRPIDYVERCFSPCMFAHGAEDKFILPHHSENLHALYAGEKSFSLIPDQDHNTVRPRSFQDTVSLFFANALLCFEQSPVAALDESAGHALGMSFGSGEEHIPGAAPHSIADAATAADLLKGVMNENRSAEEEEMGGRGEDIANEEEEALRRAIALSLLDVEKEECQTDEAAAAGEGAEEGRGEELERESSRGKKTKKKSKSKSGNHGKKEKREKREKREKKEKRDRRDGCEQKEERRETSKKGAGLESKKTSKKEKKKDDDA